MCPAFRKKFEQMRTPQKSWEIATGKAANLRLWLGETSGAAALEFGLLAVPIFLTLYAIVSLGLYMFMQRQMDHAAQVGARAIATGAVSTAGLSSSQFVTTYICPALSSTFSCSNVYLQLTTVTAGQSPSGYYAFVNSNQSGLNEPKFNSSLNVFNPGQSCQYMVLQVIYPSTFAFNIFSSALTATFNGQSVSVLSSSATFKTEPYAGAASQTGC